jgi:hypothetical protein
VYLRNQQLLSTDNWQVIYLFLFLFKRRANENIGTYSTQLNTDPEVTQECRKYTFLKKDGGD